VARAKVRAEELMRTADHPIDPLFTRRWSARAMSGQPLPREELYRLFEAARWAPSSGNNQPWRFVYGLKGTLEFDSLFDLLGEGNKPWCARAGALLVVTSRNVNDRGGRARTHSFDAGAAWMSLALQGSLLGLVVHGMEGFDYDRASAAVHLPPDHTVECMVAVGYPGPIEELPERYRAREAPNSRHAVDTFAVKGRFAG
jgi:nitroreductase